MRANPILSADVHDSPTMLHIINVDWSSKVCMFGRCSFNIDSWGRGAVNILMYYANPYMGSIFCCCEIYSVTLSGKCQVF